MPKNPDLALISFDDVLNECLQDDEVAEEYQALREQRRLAQSLKSAREARRMTQVEVAQRSGINVKNISRLERGVVSPTFATLNRYAKAIGGSFVFQFDRNL